jgi:hypothetical protein
VTDNLDFRALLEGDELHWVRLTPSRLADAIVVSSIEAFSAAGPAAAAEAAGTWLRAYDGSSESTTWILIGRGRTQGFIALSASSVLVERRDRKRQDWRYHTQPAVLLGWIGRAVDCHVGDHLWHHAVDQALRVRAHIGATVLVVDPFDEKTVGFWAARGFRPAAHADAQPPRMWLALDALV